MAQDGLSLIERLRALVGAAHLLTDADAMAPHLTDWRGRYTGRALCVVRPGTTTEVARVVAACAEAGAPMVPQGGNTGLVGGATPDGSGRQVLICLSRLNRIRAVDLANDTLTVEAGCVLAQVQRVAEENDRLFPLSLAAEGSCQIGGNLSTNAGGVHVLRYGNMRELTLGLEVVLPSGEVWDGLRGLRKDNTGYDLKQLFIGAEGTLGIITAAVVKLFPRPRQRALAWLGVADVEAAVSLLGSLQQAFGERLVACEIIGRPALELVLRHIPGSRDPLTSAWPWQVLVELADPSADGGLTQALEYFLAGEAARGSIGDGTIAQDLGQIEALWRLRESISEAQRIEGISIKHDVAVPVSRIGELLARAGAALRAAFGDVRIVAFGHLGDGNLHYNLSRPPGLDNSAFIAQTSAANRVVHDLVAELGGTISAEHGIGQLKREEILRYESPVELALMRALKAAIDPCGLMNSGKLL